MKRSADSAALPSTMATLLRSVGASIDRIFGQNSASKAAEFIYTTLLKPRFAKALANRIILSILPQTLPVGGAVVVLNRRDPVVSGALTLGVYEKSGIAFMRRVCAPGQTVLDIGANMGLYTAIAGRAVGPSGRVVAIEPDPECLLFLEQTVRANSLSNVQIVRAAASRSNGRAALFSSPSNRGDNRLYAIGAADRSVDVECIRVDDYLAAKDILAVDVIKLDVQGFEGHVIDGLEKTIRSSPDLKMLMEFWPEGLSSTGVDPAALLERLEGWGLTLFELRDDGAVDAVGDKMRLLHRLKGRKYANLVLLAPNANSTVH